LSKESKNNPARQLEGLKETLKQVQYQNEMMLRWVNGAVISVDRKGLILRANTVALETLGWDAEDFSGRHVHETIHHSQDDGSEYPWDFCPLFAAIEDGSSHHVDGDVFWQKDGNSFSTDYIVCPTRNEQNEITGAILTFRNITEQRLKESKRIHSMKLESIGELSAGIAHEINTPIQFIGNNVSFLNESFEDLLQLLEKYRELADAAKNAPRFRSLLAEIAEMEDEADVEYLQEEAPKAFEQTLDGVTRVTKLVQGLKGFAHVGSNENKQDADLNKIILDTLVVCKNAYKYVAEMETKLESLPAVPVYPGDIAQVLVNLIVNAAHAIDDNRKENSEMGKITIESFQKNGMIIISVTDSGGGIPENIQGRIFDPFFSTKEVGRGSGQGLAISRTIIHDKHDGELDFTSKPDQGTTFFIKIPLA
jgi:PAS domain S-box-containing protein